MKSLMLTMPQVSQILQIKLPQLRILVKKGLIKASPDIKSYQLIPVDSVNAFLERAGSKMRVEMKTNELPVTVFNIDEPRETQLSESSPPNQIEQPEEVWPNIKI